MSQPHRHFEASRSVTALEQDGTIIAVIEMSQSQWLVAALVPGVERYPPEEARCSGGRILRLLHRWRNEARPDARSSVL